MFWFFYYMATVEKAGTGGGYAGSGRIATLPTLTEPDRNVIGASDIEQIVLNWLDRHGIIDYSFQSSQMGGRYELGGSVVDVIFPERNLAWRIQGDYFHKPINKRATDAVQREILESQGWQVVDLWGSDIENNLEETMQKALRGEEML